MLPGTLPGTNNLTRKLRPQFLSQPRNSWFSEEVIGFDQEDLGFEQKDIG